MVADFTDQPSAAERLVDANLVVAQYCDLCSAKCWDYKYQGDEKSPLRLRRDSTEWDNSRLTENEQKLVALVERNIPDEARFHGSGAYSAFQETRNLNKIQGMALALAYNKDESVQRDLHEQASTIASPGTANTYTHWDKNRASGLTLSAGEAVTPESLANLAYTKGLLGKGAVANLTRGKDYLENGAQFLQEEAAIRDIALHTYLTAEKKQMGGGMLSQRERDLVDYIHDPSRFSRVTSRADIDWLKPDQVQDFLAWKAGPFELRFFAQGAAEEALVGDTRFNDFAHIQQLLSSDPRRLTTEVIALGEKIRPDIRTLERDRPRNSPATDDNSGMPHQQGRQSGIIQ